MASESSSAVLELNDADTEDTDATTVTDDTHEGAPLMMEHGYDIAVRVDAPMKQLSTLETFVSYRVRCVCARWPAPAHVRRRYNHFKLLHKRLTQAHPLLAPPPLPPLHSARQQLDRYSPSFVAVRTMALNAFLDRVAKHPILTHSVDFRIFLTTPDDELDKVFKSENNALNLWGLSSALYGSGESKTGNGPRVKDPEFSSAADYLVSLQHKLSTLCALTTKLHKGTAALSTELMGMKRACDAWATQAGGRTARTCSACAGGACAAARAGGLGQRARSRHAAALPLLAAYAAAHVDKIKQRDTIHAAYVSGNNATDELHNRLEQASEALRSELSDWTPKTRADIKSILLEIADRQVSLHSQTLQGWEHALKLATETNIQEIFKTVSKTAVHNLSPSKCRSELTSTETERDVDDFSEDFEVNSTTDDFYDDGKNDELIAKNDLDSVGKGNGKNVANTKDILNIDNVFKETANTECDNNINIDEDKIANSNINISGNGCESNDGVIDKISNIDGNHSSAVYIGEIIDNNDKNTDRLTQDEFLNAILDDNNTGVNDKTVKTTNLVKNEVISDPLRDFTDVDLS